MTDATYGLIFLTEDGQGQLPGTDGFATLIDAENEMPAFLQELLRVGTDDDADWILKGKFLVVMHDKGEFSDTDEIVLRKYSSDVRDSDKRLGV